MLNIPVSSLPNFHQGGSMLKKLLTVVLLLTGAANAGSDTLFFSLKDTVPFNNDSLIWIAIPPNKQAASFRHAELQVDFLSVQKTITLRDTGFRFLPLADNKSEIIINPYRLMNRYFQEAAKESNDSLPAVARQENVELLKAFGAKWRLVKTAAAKKKARN